MADCVSPSLQVDAYSSAMSLPHAFWRAFQGHGGDANIMYAHALKLKEREAGGMTTSGHHWITVSNRQELEFVLSCTSWELGNYPIFIFTTLPVDSTSLSGPALNVRIQYMAEKLSKLVPWQRV
jgi:hypothetical protein